MRSVANLWRRFWALPLWMKGGIASAWAATLVLAVALIAGPVSGGEEPQPQVRDVEPTSSPVPRRTPTPTATALAIVATPTPAPTPLPAEATAVAIQPSPTAKVRTPTPRPPPQTPEASAASRLQFEEAKTMALDWLIQQGGQWDGGVIKLPKNTLDIWWAGNNITVSPDTCAGTWDEIGRWTVSCDLSACIAFDGCVQGIVHMWIDEATLTVAWADPDLEWTGYVD